MRIAVLLSLVYQTRLVEAIGVGFRRQHIYPKGVKKCVPLNMYWSICSSADGQFLHVADGLTDICLTDCASRHGHF